MTTVVNTVEKLPQIAFVMPVLNGSKLLAGCLQTLVDQDYPKELVEIIIADGGSTDDTVQIAKSFGATVINNPYVLAEPGNDLAMKHTSAEIIFVLAADNGLPRRDWIRLMIKPFSDDPKIIGAYTQIIPSEGDNSFTEYYCRLHVEPFTWYVYGPGANPREFSKKYPVLQKTKDYTVYSFTPLDHPLIALAQGFGVRGSFVRKSGYECDDILPIIQMIEDQNLIAYVPDAGVFHHHLENFKHYVKKYTWRIHNSLYTNTAGFNNRLKFLTTGRKLRKYLFVLYGLSILFPLLDSVILSVKERRFCMLWHGPASIALSWIISLEYTKKILQDIRNVFRFNKVPAN